jgi:hypothetical protein
MALEIIRDLWFCVDCTLLACNGDTSGIDDPKREARCIAGLDKLSAVAHVSPNWEYADEGSDEIVEGHYEFANVGCDCCGSRLAGEFHRFAQLGEVQS